MQKKSANTQGLRLIFAGTPDFAAIHLKALLEQSTHQVIAVYTQPDRPAGRGKRLQASPVKELALAQGIPVYQPDNFKSPEARQELADLNADMMLVVAYGLLLPQAVLDTPRLGCINVHASLLPRWRGAAPMQRAIEAGDRETGVTLMQMEAGLDTGPMLVKASCTIEPRETAGSLHNKLADIGATTLLHNLDNLANGLLPGETQNDSLSCYAPKISKSEAEMDWSEPSGLLDRKIRAFNPFPVAFTHMGEQRVRIWAAESQAEASAGKPGEILKASENGVLVACGEGALLIQQLQLPGKTRLPVAEALKGYQALFTPGARFAGSAH